MTISLLRRALPFLAVGVCIAVAYDGYVFYSRWSSRRDAERARQEQEARLDRQTLAMLGGGGLRILDFYPSPTAIRRGSNANLCFGVTGAKTVRIEPPVESLHPAVSYCMSVAPAKSTEYKLIAEDGAGHSTTATCLLQVVR